MLEASIRAKSIPPTLEFETALTSTLSQFLYTTMVDITAAVKYYLGNALGKCSLGYSLAYLAGSFLVAAKPSKPFSMEEAPWPELRRSHRR